MNRTWTDQCLVFVLILGLFGLSLIAGHGNFAVNICREVPSVFARASHTIPHQGEMNSQHCRVNCLQFTSDFVQMLIVASSVSKTCKCDVTCSVPHLIGVSVSTVAAEGS